MGVVCSMMTLTQCGHIGTLGLSTIRSFNLNYQGRYHLKVTDFFQPQFMATLY